MQQLFFPCYAYSGE